MLRLLWSKLVVRLPERTIYLCKLVCLSAGFHGIALIVLFCFYTEFTVHTIRVNLGQIEGRPVIIVPFVTTHNQNLSQTTKKQLVQSKSLVKKETTKTTVAAKKINQKKQPVQQTVQKKEESKTAQLTKYAKKAKPTQSSVEQPPLDEQKVVKHKEVIPQSVKPTTQQVAQVQQFQPEQIEPLYVGQAQGEHYELEQLVQYAVKQNWVRPAGCAEGVSCKVSVTIDRTGKVIALQEEQSSGVLMFDSAVQCAVAQTHFPTRLAGKTVSIELC